jgi:predicted nucleic acid-binding protein
LQVLLDTSAIISLSDRSHHLHREIERIVTDKKNLCIIPSTVAVEVCQLLKYRFGAEYEIKFLKEIHKSSFIMETVGFGDFKRIIEILEKYRDINAGFIDASIVAIAERLGTNKLLTLDKKHFSVLIPSGFQFFDLLV